MLERFFLPSDFRVIMQFRSRCILNSRLLCVCTFNISFLKGEKKTIETQEFLFANRREFQQITLGVGVYICWVKLDDFFFNLKKKLEWFRRGWRWQKQMSAVVILTQMKAKFGSWRTVQTESCDERSTVFRLNALTLLFTRDKKKKVKWGWRRVERSPLEATSIHYYYSLQFPGEIAM